MSNDWWTSSQSNSNSSSQYQQQHQHQFHTPQRPNFHSQSSLNGSSRNYNNRYISAGGDELDSEDLKMVDSIKFLPSFANSPAGKLALGSSPQSNSGGGGGGGNSQSIGGGGFGFGTSSTNNNNNNHNNSTNIGSPNDSNTGRRSPGVSTNNRDRPERDSPRHHRRSLLHQNSQLGNSSVFGGGNNGGGMMIDEDMPPTASLRDSISGNNNNNSNQQQSQSQIRNNESSQSNELPQPSTLIPSSSTTSLHVFGPPLEILADLKEYLMQFGSIESYKKGPEGSNWFIVSYHNPVSASYALRRHGDILNGKYMLGFKVKNDQSSNGFQQQQQQQQQISNNNRESTAGTPLKIQNQSIVKQKQPPVSSTKKLVQSSNNSNQNEYNWDDQDDQNKNGWSGWVSERLFGR
ncbi:uncharacterized protein L201_007599 [Kwoniella dendrophila CBS 6074]|uniref:RRM Nup35-type domain-containing protein n=1 Tax=Kwoniella dendrophila CBS 6074 TaxID=1295534 RepID=A0AAX4K738_9TREE